MEGLFLVYVNRLGIENDGDNIYQLFFSSNPDDVFGEGWNEIPACNVRRDIITIKKDMYDAIAEIKTDIVLDFAQDCCCFSMQDAKDDIVALAYENLDGLEEYPDPRIVLHFGDNLEEIQDLFSKRFLTLNIIKNQSC